MKTTEPVIDGAAVGTVEVGRLEGVVVGVLLGAEVTKVTQNKQEMLGTYFCSNTG